MKAFVLGVFAGIDRISTVVMVAALPVLVASLVVTGHTRVAAGAVALSALSVAVQLWLRSLWRRDKAESDAAVASLDAAIARADEAMARWQVRS